MPSALEFVSSGGQHFGKDTGLEFVNKIGQIILKARVGQSTATQQVEDTSASLKPKRATRSLAKALHAWNSGVPIHIHVFKKSDHALLECWTINFESWDSKPNERSKLDSTQLVLLLQSIYSQIRYLPLHSLITRGIFPKEEIEYSIASYSSVCSTDCFPSGVDLTNHQFKSAATSFGTLKVGVIYEKNLEVMKLAEGKDSFESSPEQPTHQQLEGHQHPQLKRRFSALNRPSKCITKSIHLSSMKMLATLEEEEREDAAELNGVDIESEKRHDAASEDKSPTWLSRPVSIPAASPIANTPCQSLSHLFAARHHYPHKPDAVGSGLGGSADIRPTHFPRKSYNCQLNVTPPHSPLSPFKNHHQHSGFSGMHLPKFGGRRSSISSLNPSELFGSLVGSYEESILSGRMSAVPSKPIHFTAQIGVLGKGKCKPSLKCPPHLNMDFPAYFYQHGNTESPSPYVGTVDLDHQDTIDKRFPHGYRIPPKGQLQVIIKNPNKTAVKFFLIPYDFSDMPENSKTFLRQKSYSVPGACKENPTLRYAIHLQFCSPSRKRIYLYKNIRLVFSHRVPDGSERLKVVCEGPGEPKYIPALNLPSKPSLAPKAPAVADDPPPMDVNGNPIPPFSAADAFARRELRKPSITSTISESLLKMKLSGEDLRVDHDHGHGHRHYENHVEISAPSENGRRSEGREFAVVEPGKVLPK
ncbi:hypothetical protein K493DRAFT_339341 [Basidiobolus meristosporus CBS 931.73]|uniref:Atos-like conserved domain-containing protein n=1 Tax=Basidiobolus meristosporus CBS 931.73 TaxID=1314790 RepID=A0A1Y1Y0M8_9FUNG|nr:hypothetical protein K493DRAFT_339341 [Basidiobolus meristosporus CBS 931.73]|eukprot:ORX91455.1 hypothetical protein K493DRAFT_339341 [Basidiobolus meristosporus CBS 931.73]